MKIEFFRDDLPKLEAAGLGDGELNDEWRTADGRIVISSELEEVNYGAHDEREKLAAAGVVFAGWHGEGIEYGAYRFYSDGKALHEHETFNDGGHLAIAASAETGVPVREALERALTFFEGYRKIDALLSPVQAPAAPATSS